MTKEKLSGSRENIKKTEQAYNELPYLAQSFPDTHPSQLSAIGTMLGIQCPDFSNARILEIGCAAGDNLLPIALHNPNAFCVGIDLSSIQINQGKAFAERFNLDNFELKTMNIMDVDETLGKFDYIICHGVFSWVPEIVREKILDVCNSHLTKNGIAYISYNVYPGWHLKEIARNVMFRSCYHIADPKLKVQEALSALAFFVEHVDESHGSPIKKILEKELKRLEKSDPSYVLHEYLEENNTPFYFRDFVALANQKKLNYLTDVSLKSMFVDLYSKETIQGLNKLSRQRFDTEEYMDVLCSRAFRKSLLVKQETLFDLNINIERMASLYVRSNLHPMPHKSKQVLDNSKLSFTLAENEGESNVTSTSVINKTALVYLSKKYPQYVEVSNLLNLCYEKLNIETNTLENKTIMKDLNELGQIILMMVQNGLIDVVSSPLNFSTSPEDYPKAYFLAREQVKNNAKTVTSLIHKVTTIEHAFRPLFLAMDGKNNIKQLLSYIPQILKTYSYNNLFEKNKKISKKEKQLVILKEILKGFSCAALLE